MKKMNKILASAVMIAAFGANAAVTTVGQTDSTTIETDVQVELNFQFEQQSTTHTLSNNGDETTNEFTSTPGTYAFTDPIYANAQSNVAFTITAESLNGWKLCLNTATCNNSTSLADEEMAYSVVYGDYDDGLDARTLMKAQGAGTNTTTTVVVEDGTIEAQANGGIEYVDSTEENRYMGVYLNDSDYNDQKPGTYSDTITMTILANPA